MKFAKTPNHDVATIDDKSVNPEIDLKGTYPLSVHFCSLELVCNICACMLLAGLFLHCLRNACYT